MPQCWTAAQTPRSEDSQRGRTINTLVAGFSVGSQARSSKAGSIFQLPAVSSWACLEVEMLWLLFIVMLVPNCSIVLYSHDATIKWTWSLGINVGQHLASLYIQPKATLGVHTALSLALLGDLALSSFRIATEWCFLTFTLTPHFEGPHKRQL